MKNRKISMTTQAVILLAVLLLAGNLVLGLVIMNQSKSVMKSLLNERMLDISNTSADMLDGDVLKKLTKEDEGTPEFQKIYDDLKVFQDNINLSYIYTIRDEGDGIFTFMVDPAENDPGEFGQQVAVTEALRQAAKGKADVDDQPYSDGWGSFYSAYSPVFDSKGAVAGIVAVDFSAGWYESQMAKYANIILLYSVISLLIGVFVVFIITGRLRKRFRVLLSELHGLGEDMEHLTDEMLLPFGKEDAQNSLRTSPSEEDEKESGKRFRMAWELDASNDEIDELGKRIHFMQDGIREYIEHTRAQSDSMITALASDYRSVYYIDLDTDEGICYRSHSKMENGVGEGEHFSFHQTFRNYAEQYVVEEYRENFLHFIETDVIRGGLEKENIIAHRYLVLRDGQESYEMLKIVAVRTQEECKDHVIHVVGAGFTDVDRETRESMTQSQALSDALALAEDANHAKTAFLSNMSHEIRTPMNAIIGLNSLALNDMDLSDKTRDYLEKIGFSARHLLELINDILDMSRIESGRMVIRSVEFSFPVFLEQINTMINGQCSDKGLQYECSLEGEFLDYYIGDDLKLKQVIINILGNAVKFTPEGGSVSFLVKQMARFDGKTTLRFQMKDTGIGMDESFLPKIFDSFSQEDSSAANKYGSTGLGMAISKNIVEMLHGNIEVESKKGVGTTFTVTVTLEDSERKDEVVTEEQEVSQEQEKIDLSGRRILLAEDTLINTEIIKEILGMEEIEVEHAENGWLAVEFFASHPVGYYDAILMDMRMPEMDGLTATKQIRAMRREDAANIPIIALTANAFDEDVQRSLQAGVNAHLSKPVEPDRLFETLGKLLGNVDD